MTGRRDKPTAGERPRLPIRRVLVSAWHSGIGNAPLILLVAVAVSGTAAVVETLFHEFIERENLPLAIVADIVTSGVSLLGLVLLSGVLSQVVGERHGRGPVSVKDLLASLPWSRLIRADLLVALLVTVGLVFFVVPGLVLLALLAVVGPVIEIEHRTVWAAVRRSARLARPHFWGVTLLAAVPVALADLIPADLPDRAGPAEIVVFLAIRGVGEAVVEAVLGVVLAELTYMLILLDQAREGAAEVTM